MTEYVYVMSTYGEYGLVPPIVATTDREGIVALFERVFPEYVKDYLPELENILTQSDEELCCHARDKSEQPSWWNSDEPYWENGQHEIQEGWSGLQLMILRLE
jgi:hypothetical protein